MLHIFHSVGIHREIIGGPFVEDNPEVDEDCRFVMLNVRTGEVVVFDHRTIFLVECDIS